MKRLNSWFIAGGAILALSLVGTPALAADKSVNERILEILLEQGTIDRNQYDALQELAEEEQRQEQEAEKRAAALPQVAAGGEDKGWKAYWKDGARIERNDGFVKFKFGGRIQLDFAASGADTSLYEAFDNTRGTGFDFRRARLFASGSLGEYTIFKAQYDFAGQDVDFKDVYVGLQKLPVLGTVRVGHFKEPQSIEESTSSKYNTFMERSLPVLAFAPSRNTGIGVNNTFFDDRMTVIFGAFRNVGDSGEGFSNTGDYNVGFRLAGTPILQDEGETLLHAGMWYNHQFANVTDFGYDPDPESNTVGGILSFPDGVDVEGVDLLGFELAAVLGPVSLQGEVITSFVDTENFGDRTFWGSYVEASWFLTGEHRNYKSEFADFHRVKLKNTFSLSEGTFGALEAAARWSYLTLNSGGIRGGIENNMTLALNWYLFSNLQLMTNYVLANRNGVGTAHIFQTRASFDF